MTSIETTLVQVEEAEDWGQRVRAIRRIPDRHGLNEHRAVYAAIAERLYRPHLSAQFAFVPQREEYELETFSKLYRQAADRTANFSKVDVARLARLLEDVPECLIVFRTIIGYGPNELSEATKAVGKKATGLTSHRLKAMERGRQPGDEDAQLLARTIDQLVRGALWGEAPTGFKTKLDKLDTENGWLSVQKLAASGVPYEAFLHQRHMGGAFRQLLDAASEQRGEMLEEAVEALLKCIGVSYLRTGSTEQSEIERRFQLTVRPAPDFVVFEPPADVRALLECKLANDGGTARDKAARFRSLRQEATRLGGVPLFAVLDGLGWARVNDALGPVVRDCEGRVFTLQTLYAMPTVEPFPGLSRFEQNA